MLTRRQKNSIRGLTAALSSIALLSAFLIYTNISNAEKPEPVVISDILEGAVAYSGEDDTPPAVTLAENELMETMYSQEYASLLMPDDPALTVTYIPPEAVYPEETHAYTFEIPDESSESAENIGSIDMEDGSKMPDNPNEITLLSDELNALTTPKDTTSDTTATVTSKTEESSSTTTYITFTGTTTAPQSVITLPSSSATTVPTTTKTPVITTTKEKTTTAPSSTTAHTSKTPFTNVGGGSFSSDDSVYITMLKLVNNERRKAGLNELWYSARVHEVCEIRASELTSYYSHNRPDGTRFSTAFKEIGINYDKCGENIAYGRNMFSTPEEVFKAWMDSDSHRENILSPDFECCAFGLSVLKVGNDTYYYWAQEFAKL